MTDMRTGLYILLFTYGFLISYHVMGSTKFYMNKEFNWKKALLGLYQEIGYCLFLFLIFIMPQYIDLEKIGINVDLNATITAILILPLAGAIDKAYKKAAELKKMDISKLNQKTANEEAAEEAIAVLEELEEERKAEIEGIGAANEPQELSINVYLKGDLENGKEKSSS